MRFSFLFLLFAFSAESLVEKRAEPKEMTTSIIIPCDALHFPHLFPLLEHFEHQTFLPDEIVISLSFTETVDLKEIETLKNHPWPFPLILLQQTGWAPAGVNRNHAIRAASKEILICQDADDIPHPKRVETIRYFFEHYRIDHLLHTWIFEEEGFSPFEIDSIETFSFKDFRPALQFCQENNIRITNGSASFTKELGSKVIWPDDEPLDGEDVIFSFNAYDMFPNKLIVNQSLLIYRRHFSIKGQRSN